VSWAYTINCPYKKQGIHALGTVEFGITYYDCMIYGLWDASTFPDDLFKPGIKYPSKRFIYWEDLEALRE
jgi:hypothetical protein